MKSIVVSAVVAQSRRKAYAVKRMNHAAQRMLNALTVADEIQAGYWVLAWAVAAGARPSRRAPHHGHAAPAELRLH